MLRFKLASSTNFCHCQTKGLVSVFLRAGHDSPLATVVRIRLISDRVGRQRTHPVFGIRLRNAADWHKLTVRLSQMDQTNGKREKETTQLETTGVAYRTKGSADDASTLQPHKL